MSRFLPVFHSILSLAAAIGLLLSAGTGWADARTAGEGGIIELGDIPSRPVPPRYGFGRFFRIRDISNPELSADNRTLYFTRNDGRVANVFAIDLAGRGMRQVTLYDEPVHDLLVGRQGRYLILSRDRGGNESYALYRLDLKTGETLRLTDPGLRDLSHACSLSPDGSVLYFNESRNGRSESDLWRLELASGEKRVILPAAGRLLECGEVSPDGRRLLFSEFVDNGESHLGVLDLATGKARFILRLPGVNNVDAGFSGDTIYFLNALGADDFRLWQYRPGAPAPTLVRNPVHHPLASLSVQGGGRVRVLQYRTALATRTRIFVDGFARSSSFGLPEEDIAGAVFSRSDPNIGVVATAHGTLPRRWFLVNATGAAPRLLYDSNQSGIPGEQLAEVRSLRIASFDGLQIPVHLFIPNGTSADAPRPAILLIHGGPEDHVDPVFDSRIQFLANRGFVVVAPNVRGSTGFGKLFALLDNGDWGGGHIRDIVEVARRVRSLEFVDGDNLFVLGESFGGFSVLSLITQYPKVFRAAVDISGMNDLASFVEAWPPYAERFVLQELGFDPRRDAERNRAISPLYHLERIRVPLQVHQGLNDRRVPKAQSDRLVERLRALGREVEYYVYPDEGHGFSRLPDEALAFHRIVGFFHRHVRRGSVGSGNAAFWLQGHRRPLACSRGPSQDALLWRCLCAVVHVRSPFCREKMPNRAMKPVEPGTDRYWPVQYRAAIPPISARGTLSMISRA